ncbi:MAG: hypothetical protein WA655_02740 [Candidatus Korobacteraceae bacterium]
MEVTGVPYIADANLLKRLTLDFTAILIGYNVPREDARRVAAQAIQPVRDHLAATGSVLRVVRI